MPATTFAVDKNLDATLESLRLHYGASSKAAILRKSLAMLAVASQHEDSDGNLTIRHNGEDILVLMRAKSMLK